MQKRLFIANFKNYLTAEQERIALQTIPEPARTDDQLVVLPSLLSLSHCREWLADKRVAFGSQTCSSQGYGAFTGQIPALELATLGCRFCLVGHSEERAIANDLHRLGDQLAQVLQAGMTPIVCVGYGITQQEGVTAASRLTDEFETIMTRAFSHGVKPTATIIIAYEPHWAIGTGIVPSGQDITHVADKLHSAAQQMLNSTRSLVIYGGSVTQDNCKELINLPSVNGLLIGRASTNGQELQNIINC